MRKPRAGRPELGIAYTALKRMSSKDPTKSSARQTGNRGPAAQSSYCSAGLRANLSQSARASAELTGAKARTTAGSERASQPLLYLDRRTRRAVRPGTTSTAAPWQFLTPCAVRNRRGTRNKGNALGNLASQIERANRRSGQGGPSVRLGFGPVKRNATRGSAAWRYNDRTADQARCAEGASETALGADRR